MHGIKYDVLQRIYISAQLSLIFHREVHEALSPAWIKNGLSLTHSPFFPPSYLMSEQASHYLAQKTRQWLLLCSGLQDWASQILA